LKQFFDFFPIPIVGKLLEIFFFSSERTGTENPCVACPAESGAGSSAGTPSEDSGPSHKRFVVEKSLEMRGFSVSFLNGENWWEYF